MSEGASWRGLDARRVGAAADLEVLWTCSEAELLRVLDSGAVSVNTSFFVVTSGFSVLPFPWPLIALELTFPVPLCLPSPLNDVPYSRTVGVVGCARAVASIVVSPVLRKGLLQSSSSVSHRKPGGTSGLPKDSFEGESRFFGPDRDPAVVPPKNRVLGHCSLASSAPFGLFCAKLRSLPFPSRSLDILQVKSPL
jgi:hypothetical protein